MYTYIIDHRYCKHARTRWWVHIYPGGSSVVYPAKIRHAVEKVGFIQEQLVHM